MNFAEQLPVLQVAVPLLTAPLCVLLRDSRLAWATASLASLMAFAIAVALTMDISSAGTLTYEMGGWPPPFGIELHVSAFSALMLLLITGSSTLALLCGRESLSQDIDESRSPLFYAAWLIAVAGLIGIAIAGDAFNVFVFMEISSLATYILVAAGPDRRALTATFKYLVMGTVGATFYLIGVGLIYMMTGTLNFADIEARIADVSDDRPILVAAGFITVGLALKAAVFPLHVWLPNAYTHAPNIVTMFIAACSTKVAVFVLLRFDFFVFQANLDGHVVQFAGFLMPLALLGIVVGSAVAMVEGHLKRLFAYSSVAQVGYILLGASFSSTAGLTAGVVHMFNHALAKGTLFLALAALAMRLKGLRLDDIAGAGRQMPWTMATLVIAGASLVGIPGTAGFISKWLLLTAAFQQGTLGIVAAIVVVASSLAAVVYVWRIIERAYFGAPVAGIGTTESPAEAAREAPWPMLLGLWVAALANVYFGLVPDLPVGLAQAAAAALLSHLP